MGEKGDLILKAILDNGGRATSKEIIDATGYPHYQFHGIMRRLLQRGLVLQEKTTQSSNSGGWLNGISTYSIKPAALPKVLRLVRDRFGGDYV